MSSYCVKCGSVLNNYECPICGAKYRAKTVYTPHPTVLCPIQLPTR